MNKGISTLTIILSIALATSLTFIIVKRRSPQRNIVAASSEGISAWMNHINSSMSKTSGTFLTEDKRGIPVIFEWEKVLCKEQGFVDNMKTLSDLLAVLFADINLERLRKYPEHTQDLIKFFAKDEEGIGNLIEEGIIQKNPEKGGSLEIVNYDLYKKALIQQMRSMIQAIETTHKMFGIKGEDIFIFVKVKDKETEELIGCAIFWINEDCQDGHVIIWNIALEPNSQGRGLGKLLASSIFKILPGIKSIGLGVYSTNEPAIAAYKAWGFVAQEPAQTEGFRDVRMDYFAEQSDRLQKATENLTPLE